MMQENSEISVGKKNNSIVIILLIAVFTLILGVVLFYFKDKLSILNLNKKVDGDNVSTQSEALSPFENLVEKGINEQLGKVSLGIDKSIEFVLANKAVSDDKKPVLSDGDILIEVTGDGESRAYKLIASKNSSLRYGIGDNIEFTPKIDPDFLFVISEVNIIYKSNDSKLGGFKIPDNLKHGDKVVFNCENPTCEDSLLSWALVFENY